MEGLNIAGTIDMSLEVAGHRFRAVTCDVEEGLSSCGRVVVEVQSFEDIDFEPLIEEEATVLITIAGLEVRRFTRRLGRAAFVGLKEMSLRYALELFPTFHFLQLEMDTRKFRDMTTEAIVTKVLDASGVKHTWRNARPCASRPYTVQYRETNFAFVSRLLEFEGVYYYFEPDGTMVLGDDTPSEADVAGVPLYQLRETEQAGAHGDVGITSFVRGATTVSGKATVNDYSWKTPKLSLLASHETDRDADLEIYDYPTGYRDPGTGKTLAQLRSEALSCEKQWVEGAGNVPWFAAGKHFFFQHTEALDFSGKYLLVRVSHRFLATVGEEQRGSYDNRFFAIPSTTPWRPLLTTPRPIVQGNHTAMVRGPVGEEIHTDTYGRAKVQFHWDREATGTDVDSRWIRVAQETSSSMVLYRVGWEVVVGYVDGDPDRPIGLARNINGQMVPTYGQPSRKNMMTIKTESYPGKMGFNELRLDDSVGTMRMDWHAQNDLLNSVENDKTERIVNDHVSLIKGGIDRAVEKNQILAVGGDETKDVQADYNENVKKNRTETIGGSENVQIATSGARNVQGNDVESVGGLRLTFAGIPSVSIPSPKDMMKTLVPHTLGAITDGIGASGVFAQSAVDLGSGARLGDVAANAGKAAAEAAIGALSSGGDVGAAVSGAMGLPKGGDLGAALKGAIPSADQLVAGAKDMALDMLLKGTISRDVRKRLTRTVGGAWVQLAGGSIMNSTGKLFVEAIGGLKLTATKGSIMQSATKFLVDTVGGMVMRKSKDDMSVSAMKTVVRVGAMAKMHSDELLELRGKEIEIEGQEKVTLKSGDMLIELTPTGTTIKGTLKVQSGDSIKIAGNPDELTA